jgi:hypothetical protein
MRSMPMTRNPVPGLVRIIGAKSIVGAKIKRRRPTITVPKQKANQDAVAIKARIQSANPAIKAQMP